MKDRHVSILVFAVIVAAAIWAGGLIAGDKSDTSRSVGDAAAMSVLEADNPLVPLPKPPLGIDRSFEELSTPPTPETVRLGRWLFFDKRLSADGTISCATCHRPENGFSEPTAVSTGIHGQKGNRKAPPVLNLAWPIFPAFFWDGRAASLEAQALGPVENPVEMGNTHKAMIATLSKLDGYRPYFRQAFGDDAATKERVARALADYQRTRMSGDSPWDRWQAGDANAVTEQVRQGHALFFFGKAACNQCHLGANFTDSQFHNLGVGWDANSQSFKDDGRYAISRKSEDKGAFRTPTLREVARRAPYMHDGSHLTLKEVVEFYNKGGQANPHLSPKMKPLNLNGAEVEALVAFMEALNGQGFQDIGPKHFPSAESPNRP